MNCRFWMYSASCSFEPPDNFTSWNRPGSLPSSSGGCFSNSTRPVRELQQWNVNSIWMKKNLLSFPYILHIHFCPHTLQALHFISLKIWQPLSVSSSCWRSPESRSLFCWLKCVVLNGRKLTSAAETVSSGNLWEAGPKIPLSDLTALS